MVVTNVVGRSCAPFPLICDKFPRLSVTFHRVGLDFDSLTAWGRRHRWPLLCRWLCWSQHPLGYRSRRTPRAQPNSPDRIPPAWPARERVCVCERDSTRCLHVCVAYLESYLLVLRHIIGRRWWRRWRYHALIVVSVLFKRIEYILRIRMHQIGPGLPQWMHNVIDEAHLWLLDGCIMTITHGTYIHARFALLVALQEELLHKQSHPALVER